jgi:hypothetical protein
MELMRAREHARQVLAVVMEMTQTVSIMPEPVMAF